MRRVLIVDSLAAAGGGAASASSNTTFIESSAGIGEGARTGLASVMTGLLFACCLFISPLAGIIPSAATAPVLVIVGAMMFELVRHLEWTRSGDRAAGAADHRADADDLQHHQRRRRGLRLLLGARRC